MSGKKKYRSGKLNAVTEHILIEALQLWQADLVGKIRAMESDGKRSMIHPNWTALMMREFGIEFGVEELTNVEPIQD